VWCGKSPIVRHSTTVRAFTVRFKHNLKLQEHFVCACVCSLYILARYSLYCFCFPRRQRKCMCCCCCYFLFSYFWCLFILISRPALYRACISL